MRVYELGRSLGRSNQEIMKILTRNGIRVTSHMSVLEENQIEMVRKTVEANEKSKMENQKNTEGEAPKKKNISQVFHPQNSRSGISRPAGQKSQKPARRKACKKRPGKQRQVVFEKCPENDMAISPFQRDYFCILSVG